MSGLTAMRNNLISAEQYSRSFYRRLGRGQICDIVYEEEYIELVSIRFRCSNAPNTTLLEEIFNRS